MPVAVEETSTLVGDVVVATVVASFVGVVDVVISPHGYWSG